MSIYPLPSDVAARIVELKRERDNPPPVPHPAPVVSATEIRHDSAPSVVQSFMRWAIERGWICTLTYARGTTLDRRARGTGKLVDSFAVRMRRGGRRAVAIWWRDVESERPRVTSQGVFDGLRMSTLSAWKWGEDEARSK